MNNKKFDINRLSTDALLLAMLVVCAWVSVPISAVPVTLQVLGVILVILLAPGLDSILIVLAYCLMGTFGLPVFNGGSSGFTSITYGFIVGFLVATVIIYGYVLIFQKKREEKLLDIIIKCVLFEIVIYAIGVPWVSVLATSKTFWGWCVYFIPYLGIDAIKIVIAILIYTRLRSIVSKQQEQNKRVDSEEETSNE